jgi:hypothetical protein
MAGICRPASVTVGPSVAVSAYAGATDDRPSAMLDTRPTESCASPLSTRSASARWWGSCAVIWA